jgi:hypothetical protein
MALTAEKFQTLTDYGFLDLFNQHKQLWKNMTEEAFKYTKEFVEGAGLPVRPDDVIALLVPALQLAEEFGGSSRTSGCGRNTGGPTSVSCSLMSFGPS